MAICRARWLLPSVCSFCLAVTSWGQSPGVVALRLERPEGVLEGSVPVTFGQVFRRGDVARGVAVQVSGQPIPAQVDVKRHYDDGSVRFAVVSAVLSADAMGEGISLELSDGKPEGGDAPGIPLESLLETGFDTVVRFRFPGGATCQASAREMLLRDDGQPAAWLEGPVVSEWIVSGAPVDAAGEPDPDLNVQFLIRFYPTCNAIRVSVCVENCWDHWAEAIGYDVSVEVNGRQAFVQPGVQHRRLSRWRKIFWSRSSTPQVHVAHDLDYITSTGSLPRYDTSLDVLPASDWREQQLQMDGPHWQIMGRGALTAYMPTTGGRDEIAPYPSWTVRYLMTQEPQRKALVLASGDLAGSWPIHVRARANGRIMTIDQRPEFWLDERGKDKPVWQPPRNDAGLGAERLTPDLAHQGSFAYVPYLVTGDYFYLEEAYFWANYCLLATWYHPRQNERGILSGQVRGDAWALRNLADAASIASDDDPERRYFDEKVRNNIQDRIEGMSQPPAANPLGFWHLRTTEDARIPNPANPRWMIIAPWEHDYLMWSFHHLVELGYADAAKPRDSLLRWRVGALTNAPDIDPAMATPYRMAVGERTASGEIMYYDNWKKLAEENARLYPPEVPNYGNSYAYSARAAVIGGVDGGFPQAAEALAQIERLLPDHRQVMAREPAWAIAPGGAAARE